MVIFEFSLEKACRPLKIKRRYAKGEEWRRRRVRRDRRAHSIVKAIDMHVIDLPAIAGRDQRCFYTAALFNQGVIRPYQSFWPDIAA
jgi:hypothetical protein